MSFTALGAVVGLLGVAGVFATGSDRATTGVNDAISGENDVVNDIDLQLASATFDLTTGAFTCGEDWADDLTTGVVLSGGEEIDGQYPFYENLDEGVLCVRNVGTSTAELTVAALDVVDTELACSPGEQEAGDPSCGTGVGELSNHLNASFFNAGDGTMTGPVADTQNGGNCYEVASFGNELIDLVDEPASLGTIEPGQTRGLCADVTWNGDARSQSDQVQWRYAFDGVTPTEPVAVSCVADDGFEPNDTRATAADAGLTPVGSLTGTVCEGNDDWFLAAGDPDSSGDVTITLTWTGSADLDLYAFDPSGSWIGSAAGSVGSSEELTLAESRIGFIRVSNYRGDEVGYTLSVSEPMVP